MAATDCYLDTSALIKLYVPEAYSNEVENFLAGEAQPVISRLSVLEWHCAMARRQRTGSIAASYLAAAREEFTRHLTEGYFLVQPFGDAQLISAQAILNKVNPVPLRTLDALHLAAAHDAKLGRLATADKIMADAARQLDITVHTFFA